MSVSVISVQVGAAVYAQGSVISAVVVNGGPGGVFVEDQKSDCTVVMLEGRAGGGWTAYSTCGQERAPRTVTVAAGERLPVRIDLGSENFRPLPAGAGEYRLVFSFRRAAQPAGSEPERVTSAIFHIE